MGVIALTMSLAACGTTSQPAPVVPPHNAPVPIVQPTPMNLKNVTWKVYTVDQLEAIVAQLKAKGQNNVTFYVLDQDDFDALAYNLTEMQRYIRDQKSTNDYLIRAIEINGDTSSQTDAPIVTNPQAATPAPK